MPIISKETWDKFTQEEKEKLRKEYSYLLKAKDCDEERRDCHIGALVNMDDLFGKENLQPHPLTYEDVARELFKDKKTWYINEHSSIQGTLHLGDSYRYKTNLMTSRKQAEKILAINKLLNVAKFLNKDWKPDWSNDEDKWSLCVDPDTNKVKILKVYHSEVNRYIVYFRTEELAQQAIQILGEDTVRLALDSSY